MRDTLKARRHARWQSDTLALTLGSGALVLASPAQALLFNGVDYQKIGPDLYQVSLGQGVEQVSSAEVPAAVRDVLEALSLSGELRPGIVPYGDFTTADSLMLANARTPLWYEDSTNIAALSVIAGAGAVAGGAAALVFLPDGPVIEPPEPPEPVAGYFTGDANIDALLYPADDPISPMAHWLGSGTYDTPVALTYSFAIDPMPTTSFSGFEAFGELEKQRTRDVMEAIESAINITLTEVMDQGQGTYTADGQNRGHINLAYDTNGLMDDPIGVTEGWAYVPFGDNPMAEEDSGDVHLNPSAYREMYFEDPLGGGSTVLIHEIGHALGLAHGFEEPFMAPWLDTDLYTIMTETLAWSSGEGGQSPASLMIYDIAALQQLYGANISTAIGDTVYTFRSDTPVFETIWDAGGIDTIVHVGATNATIDLAEGAVSTVGGMPQTKWVTTVEELTDAPLLLQAVNVVSGASHLSTQLSDDRTEFAVISTAESYWLGGVEFEVVYSDATSENFVLTDLVRNVPQGNVGIAFDTVIENASTDAGNDVIYGNAANNRIDPGAGSDYMHGGEGADIFVFQPGYGTDEVGDFESGIDSVELEGFAPGDYTTSYTGYSTVLSFNTGDQLTLYTGGPVYAVYEEDFVYVA